MIQTGHWEEGKALSAHDVSSMLKDHFEKVDFLRAKNDVMPFLKDQLELDLWDRSFFIGLADRLKHD